MFFGKWSASSCWAPPVCKCLLYFYGVVGTIFATVADMMMHEEGIRDDECKLLVQYLLPEMISEICREEVRRNCRVHAISVPTSADVRRMKYTELAEEEITGRSRYAAEEKSKEFVSRRRKRFSSIFTSLFSLPALFPVFLVYM